jgi:hypothetical protein
MASMVTAQIQNRRRSLQHRVTINAVGFSADSQQVLKGYSTDSKLQLLAVAGIVLLFSQNN